jgi:hypothetical protein
MNREAEFSWPGGARAAVSLSFDDARPSQADAGLKILDFYGVKATFYLSPDRLAERIGEWRKAAAAGHEMGNHTVTHPCTGNFDWSRRNSLEDYTLERMEAELEEANRLIQDALGVKPRTFAYPCGQTFVGRGEGTRSYVPLIGKKFLAGRAYMSEYSNNPLVCDLAQLGGEPLDGLASMEVVPKIQAARETGAWVVFAGHEVADKGVQVTRAAAVEKVCEWMRDPASGVWTATVAEVAEYISGFRARQP